MPRLLLVGIIAAVVLVVGGGATAIGFVVHDRNEQAKAEAAAEAEKQHEKEAAEAIERERQQRSVACERSLGPLLEKLSETNSRLDIGMIVGEYNSALGDTKVVYDQIDFEGLTNDPYCLGEVGVPLEDAFNAYVEAGSTWGDCVTDFGCDLDGVMPGIQEKWSTASGLVNDAKSALNDYQPDDLEAGA